MRSGVDVTKFSRVSARWATSVLLFSSGVVLHGCHGATGASVVLGVEGGGGVGDGAGHVIVMIGSSDDGNVLATVDYAVAPISVER